MAHMPKLKGYKKQTTDEKKDKVNKHFGKSSSAHLPDCAQDHRFVRVFCQYLLYVWPTSSPPHNYPHHLALKRQKGFSQSFSVAFYYLMWPEGIVAHHNDYYYYRIVHICVYCVMNSYCLCAFRTHNNNNTNCMLWIFAILRSLYLFISMCIVVYIKWYSSVNPALNFIHAK